MNLKAARKAAGYTQKTAAEALGVKPGTYRNWEQGLVDLNSARIAQVSALFGVSADEILGITPEGDSLVERIHQNVQRMDQQQLEVVDTLVEFVLSRDRRL